MKIFKRVLIGCLGLVVLVVVGLAVTAGIMVGLGPPETQPGESARHEEPVAGERLPARVDPAPGEVPLPEFTSRARVEIDLEEGEFRVEPGNRGEGIRVEGDYDAGLYELRHETIDQGTTRTVRISLKPRYTILRRLLTLGDAVEPKNRLKIYLPPDVALELHCRIAKGESRIDLSGLALTDLDLDLRMGDHRVRMEEPNQLSMETLRLRVSMGEFEARRMGNARFRNARVQGSMGEMELDLRGEYVEDAAVVARFSMGEVRLVVPSDIRTEVSRRVMIGGASGNRRPDRDIPEDAPRLTVDSSVTMGELRVTWD